MIAVLKNIKALIFDCDGTLVDSIPLHIEAWKETFAAHGRSFPHKFIEKHNGMSAIEIIRHYNQVHNDDLNVMRFAEEKESRLKEKLPLVKPIIPVADVVNRYKGILPMVICSGSYLENVKIAISVIGFENFFDFIITADDGLRLKPFPDMFLEAARRLDVKPEECQVFEDCDLGIVTANNAGMVATDIRLFVN
jgi:HAD superfamily hydrolase (TIGR01509 family)